MNGIVKAALRLPSLRTIAVSPLLAQTRLTVGKDFTRGIRHMCAPRQPGDGVVLLHNHSNTCSCGCGLKGIHTKEMTEIRESFQKKTVGERELVEFLTEEIVAETKSRKMDALPTEIDGFKISVEGAEITLSKKHNDETISVVLNVNHTVDAEEGAETDPNSKPEEFTEMRSHPQFEVDIAKGNKTVSFTCSYVQDSQPTEGDGYTNDIFGIDEVTYYEGEWNDKTYAVAGDVLDGYLYDLLMNLLEEKGISNEFAEKLSDYSTAYEHSSYIKLLQNLSLYTTGK